MIGRGAQRLLASKANSHAGFLRTSTGIQPVLNAY